MQELAGGGAMIAISAAEDEVAASLPEGGDAVIAAVNGPASVVVSGTRAAVMAVGRRLAGAGRAGAGAAGQPCVPFAADGADAGGVGRVAAGLSLADPLIPVASSVTGQVAGPGQLAEPGYWAEQVRQPVRFGDCARALAEAGAGTFIELGPDGALSVLGPDSTSAAAARTARAARCGCRCGGPARPRTPRC